VWDEPTAIHVAGEIDIATADEFGAVLDRCQRDPLVHTLDLSAVDFFSAAGVRCVVARAWPDCPHPAIVASVAVRKVLDICGLELLLAPQRRQPASDARCRATRARRVTRSATDHGYVIGPAWEAD
jgi:anti-anti-sigma factor